MAKSKIISFRVPYEDYAQVLISCSKTNTDISDYAREKFYYSSAELEKELQNINNEWDKTHEMLMESRKSEGVKDDEIRELRESMQNIDNENFALKTQVKDLETEIGNHVLNDGLQKDRIKDLEQECKKLEKVLESCLAEGEKLKKENKSLSQKIEDTKEALKTDYKAKLGEKSKELAEMKGIIENLEKRLNNANTYCSENGIGTGFLGTGEAVQF